MKILCHVAPWCYDYFSFIAASIDPSAEIYYISTFAGYNNKFLFRFKSVYRSSHSYSPTQRDFEIIARCRLLRHLPFYDSINHIYAARECIHDELSTIVPDLVLCESTDQYFHDILIDCAESRGIPVIGLIRSFVNGYYRFTLRGEPIPLRCNIDNQEVSACLSVLLNNNYTPRNLLSIKKSLISYYIRNYLSHLVKPFWFTFLARTSQNNLNYHYQSSISVSCNYYQHLLPTHLLPDPNWKSQLSSSDKPILFVPLQHFPEATIDYWTEDSAFIDYNHCLIRFLSLFSKHFHILIKEHPGVIGFRRSEFYRNIKSLTNLTICPAGESASLCLSHSDATFVWTGSIGFETALRNKPVFSPTTPYYFKNYSYPLFKKISFTSDFAALSSFTLNSTNITESLNPSALMHSFLSIHFQGRFQNDGSFSLSSQEDKRAARAIARDINDYLLTL